MRRRLRPNATSIRERGEDRRRGDREAVAAAGCGRRTRGGGRRRARRRDVLLCRRHVCRERVAARSRDPPDGGRRRGRELVAVGVARDVDAVKQRPGIPAGDGPKPPVERRSARHARAVRRHDEHGCRKPMIDQRCDFLRITLRRSEHHEVVDQVLRTCHEGYLDRIAAPCGGVEQTEQLELASLRRLARVRRVQRVGLEVVARRIAVRMRGRGHDERGDQRRARRA